jgi:isopenicillin N synthase-like dioxygenase
MRGMAVSLELEEDMFDRGLTDDSFWVMRVIGYTPAGSPGGVEGSVGCGEHTDYGCLTIVNQDQNHASLQVMDKRTGEF